MDWRSRILVFCGPGMLAGITFSDWMKLLRAEGRSFDFKRLPRACTITIQSLKNSARLRGEQRRYGALVEQVVAQPPLFILGHWRSGTTFLHELLARDSRFGFPNSYQVSFPHTFLSTEASESPMVRFFLPRRRPMDQMAMRLEAPQEDEFALCASTFKSPCLAWVFPRQKEKFGKYLTFRGVAPAEVEEWKAAFVRFVKKVQYLYPRPLVLKSPPHTARVRLLLELFPEARFVHIHRDPYAVFQSTRRTLRILLGWHTLQRAEVDDFDEWILRQYHEMYEAFFEERNLVPAGKLHEMCFEELEADPMGELRKLYGALKLPDFGTVEPKLRDYVASLRGYQKNSFSELAPEWKARVAREWKRCFEEWGYATAAPKQTAGPVTA